MNAERELLSDAICETSPPFDMIDELRYPIREKGMSEFGDGTFKQAILDGIKAAQGEHNKTTIKAVEAVAEVLANLAETARFEAEEAEFWSRDGQGMGR